MAVGLRARTEETKITELPSIANLARSRLQKSELDVLGVHRKSLPAGVRIASRQGSSDQVVHQVHLPA